MSALEIIALGVGDTFTRRHHTTSLLLRCDEVQLGIDCPDTYLKVLGDAAEKSGQLLPASEIDHMLITHIHGDHMNGLEGFAFYKHFVEGSRLKLLTAPELSAALWTGRLEASMGQLWNGESMRRLGRDAYFEDIPLSWETETEAGPYRIRCRRTRHHVPTSALLIEAGGQTLGYSADTAFDPELIAWLDQADLIIHETNYGPAHTPYEALAALPEGLRAKMRLIHYSDFFDLEGSVILPMREGDLLRLG